MLSFLKGLLKSKTFWGNVLAIAGLFFLNNYGEPIPTIDAESQAEYLALFNIIIRFFTTQSLAEKGRS